MIDKGLLVEDTAAEANRKRQAADNDRAKPTLGTGIPVTCGSCGKQTIVDGLDETCTLCGQPVRPTKSPKNMPKNIPEIDQSAKEKKEMVTQAQSQVTTEVKTLPPVPARPDTSGLPNLRARLRAIGDYYDANRNTIVDEWELMGRPTKLERWGMSYGSLQGALRRWGLKPKPEKKAAEAAAKPPAAEAKGTHHKYPTTRKPAIKVEPEPEKQPPSNGHVHTITTTWRFLGITVFERRVTGGMGR